MAKKYIFSTFKYVILLFASAIMLFPIVYIVLSSFKTNSEILVQPEKIFPAKFVLDNYITALNSEDFNVLRLFGNSVYFSTCVVVIILLISTFVGYAFARGEFRLKKMWFGIFSSLMFIGLGSITTYPKFQILNWLHIPINLNGLIFQYIFTIPTVYIYLVRGYIMGLPKELDEAARIDGCDFLQTGFRVIFPLLKPIIATVGIMAFQASWNNYLTVMVYTLSRPEQRTLMVGLMSLNSTDGAATSWNLILAGTVFAIIPILLLFLFCNKFILDGVTEGAVKG